MGILADFCRYQIERGLPQESLKLLQLAQPLLESALVTDQFTLAYAYQVHAQAANLTNSSSIAVTQAKQSLEILEAFDFSERMQDFNALPRAYSEVSEALIMEHRYDEAMLHARKAIPLFISMGDQIRYYPIHAVCNLAVCLWNKGGEDNFREASQVLNDALASQTKFFGADHSEYRFVVLTSQCLCTFLLICL